MRWLAIVVAFGCAKAKPEQSDTPVTAPTTADADADDVVRVMRLYYPLGQAVGSEDWKWAGCHDRTMKGYANLLECEEGILRKITELNRSMPGSTANSACGKQIEEAHRDYVRAQMVFHTDLMNWLTEMKPKLAARMVGKTAFEACGAVRSLCDGRPNSWDEKYGARHGATLGRMGEVECTKDLFECLPGRGNVCEISKVAARLGLTDSPNSGALLVKATGRRIN